MNLINNPVTDFESGEQLMPWNFAAERLTDDQMQNIPVVWLIPRERCEASDYDVEKIMQKIIRIREVDVNALVSSPTHYIRS